MNMALDRGKTLLHCNWYEANCCYSYPALAAVHMRLQWDALLYVIHDIIPENLSTN